MSGHKPISLNGEIFYYREVEKTIPRQNGLNISLRDLELDMIKAKGWAGVIPWYEGEYMIIRTDLFWTGDMALNPPIRSRINLGQTIQLVDFLWLPEGKISDLIKTAK